MTCRFSSLLLNRRIPFALIVVAIAMLQPAWAQRPSAAQLHTGYLFIEGQYIAPPYNIQASGNSISINGEVFEASYFDLTGFEREDFGREGRGRFDRRRGMNWGPHFRGGGGRRFHESDPLTRVTELLHDTSFGTITVLYEQQKMLSLFPGDERHRFLAALVGDSGSDLDGVERLSEEEQSVWDRLVADFEPSPEFMARAKAELEAGNKVVEEGERASAANLLVAQISYPLTVVAMIVVVLAFGHLLSNRPEMDADSEGSERQQVVVKSLMIIALFSALDLIWTLAATNAGTMRELNPLGSRFIADPALLVAFKVAVTGTSIGILYVLQRRPIAQVASWWCCLVLTLLTARWVVFQSMFA